MLHDNNGSTNGSNGKNGHHPEGGDGNVIRFRSRAPEKGDAPSHPPMINLPPVTKLILGAIILIHLAVWSSGFINAALPDSIYAYGSFTSASWSGTLPFMWWTPLTLVTFSFLHGGWLHLIVNTVMLAAFGSAVEKWLGARRMLAVFAGSSLIALALHFVADPSSTASVVGISGGISGFFGALLIMMQQENMLGNRRNSILPFIAIWVVISIVFGYMGAPDGSPIAWLAHIGGFFGGLGIVWWMLGRPRLFSRR